MESSTVYGYVKLYKNLSLPEYLKDHHLDYYTKPSEE